MITWLMFSFHFIFTSFFYKKRKVNQKKNHIGTYQTKNTPVLTYTAVTMSDIIDREFTI